MTIEGKQPETPDVSTVYEGPDGISWVFAILMAIIADTYFVSSAMLDKNQVIAAWTQLFTRDSDITILVAQSIYAWTEHLYLSFGIPHGITLGLLAAIPMAAGGATFILGSYKKKAS